ncbi:hypothetical protein ACFO5R_12240 [Halosolutus amylolyticus]|uniref:DUF1102 domain-containing protein n=1 Tax=Halosolutus amylolyticus TaxID=2932267 RepID=A0ABD5PPZ5_9EURY|nr:hypothetical protein [Halosolutus amylolyticus]
MNRLKLASTALLIVAVLLLLLGGSGAFSSTEADRSSAVSVVGDDDAYLAFDYENSSTVTFESGETKGVFNVTNNFENELDPLEVSIYVGEYDESGNADETVQYQSVGSNETVSIEAACNASSADADVELDSGTESLTFEVEADGDSVDVDTTSPRKVSVECKS